MSTISRRDFVKGASAGTAALAVAGTSLVETGAALADEAIAWQPPVWDGEADVVVAGFGAAGSAAAISAADEGATVLLLEKAPEQDAGGDMSVCYGTLDLGLSGGTAMDPAIYNYATAYKLTDDEVQDYVNTWEHTTDDWVAGLGIELNFMEVAGREGSFSNIASEDGTSSCNGWLLFNEFKRVVLERADKIDVRYETPVTELVQDPTTGRVIGVKAGSPDAPQYFKANKGVILCCGDYAGDLETFADLHMPGAYIPTIGSPYNTGDALRMAMRAGARVSNIRSAVEWSTPCLTQPSKDAGTGIAFGQSLPSFNDFNNSYIFVNVQGKRFVNEMSTIEHSHLNPLSWFEFTDQSEVISGVATVDYNNLPAFLVFDQDMFDSAPLARHYGNGGYGWNTGSPEREPLMAWSDDNEAELEAGYIVSADTIEELAEKMTTVTWKGKTVTVDPAGLAATIETYNETCDSGDDDPEFGRAADTMIPLLEPPFYAIEISPSTLYAIGGPSVDAHRNAVDWEGNPIPGLFIAGNAGNPCVMYTSANHGAVNGGRIAAHFALVED